MGAPLHPRNVLRMLHLLLSRADSYRVVDFTTSGIPRRRLLRFRNNFGSVHQYVGQTFRFAFGKAENEACTTPKPKLL